MTVFYAGQSFLRSDIPLGVDGNEILLGYDGAVRIELLGLPFEQSANALGLNGLMLDEHELAIG